MASMFWAVTLGILAGFQCSWVRWNALDLYFITHPRTLKSDKYTQSYGSKHPHYRLQRDLENHKGGGKLNSHHGMSQRHVLRGYLSDRGRIVQIGEIAYLQHWTLAL